MGLVSSTEEFTSSTASAEPQELGYSVEHPERTEGTGGAGLFPYRRFTDTEGRLPFYRAGADRQPGYVPGLRGELDAKRELMTLVAQAIDVATEFLEVVDDIVARDDAFGRFLKKLSEIWLRRDRREAAFERIVGLLLAGLKGLKSEEIRAEQWVVVKSIVQKLKLPHVVPNDIRLSLEQIINVGLSPVRPLGNWSQQEG